MIFRTVTHFIYNVSETALSDANRVAEFLRDEVKKGYHSIKIRDAKDACENDIKHFLKNGDDTYLIECNYKDCSSKDKEKILADLRKRVGELDKQINELKNGDKTQKFCLFGERTSKSSEIFVKETAKGRIETVLSKLSNEQKLQLR